MTTEPPYEIAITHYIDAVPEKVWQVLTQQTEQWWCPKPWRVSIHKLELHPGGAFDTTMHGPDGEEFSSRGVVLEATANQRLVFSDALDSDWNPQGPFMVGIMELQPEGDGTRYTGKARHWTEDAMREHLKMGFEEGWKKVAGQLAELAENEEQK